MTPSLASPISFDCDVPSDHFSTISQPFTKSARISGTVTMAGPRSGTYLPVAGARIATRDDKSSASLQLVLPTSRSKQFDIVLRLKQNGEVQQAHLGTTDVQNPIDFALSLSEMGDIVASIDGKDFKAKFGPLQDGNATFYCSTGEFKFSSLMFPDASPTATAQ